MKRPTKRSFAPRWTQCPESPVLPPPNANDESLRTFEEFEGTTLELFPPIYCIDSMDLIPFNEDTNVAWLTQTCTDQGEEDRSVRNLSLGPPLWGAMLKRESIRKARYFAQIKIRGGVLQDIYALEGLRGDLASIALLAHRINFYITHSELADNLVSGYLRYILYINKDRTFLRTFQTSEPLLAFSSARLMQRANNRLRLIKVLHRYLMEGSIHVGDIGEIVASLILLFTFDKSQTRDYPSPLNPAEFIVLLFGEELFNQISKASKLPERGLVFFNHFVRATRPPTQDLLWQAYQRGAAFMPELNFSGCDIIVPICFLTPKPPNLVR